METQWQSSAWRPTAAFHEGSLDSTDYVKEKSKYQSLKQKVSFN